MHDNQNKVTQDVRPCAKQWLSKKFANKKYQPGSRSVPCVLRNLRNVTCGTPGPTSGKQSHSRQTPTTGKSSGHPRSTGIDQYSPSTKSFAVPNPIDQSLPTKFFAVPSQTDQCCPLSMFVAKPSSTDQLSPSTKSVAISSRTDDRRRTTKPVSEPQQKNQGQIVRSNKKIHSDVPDV